MNSLRADAIAARALEGHNVTIDERPGQGRQINANISGIPSSVDIATTGQTGCCFSALGFEWAYATWVFSSTMDSTGTLPGIAVDSWEITGDPWTTLVQYSAGNCGGGGGGLGSVNVPGGFSLSKSGSIYTFKSWVVVGGVKYYDFNGSGSAPSFPNGLTSCNGINAGFGGIVTIAL